jgi:hypothetical protein
LLELLHIKNVDELSFLCSLLVAPEGVSQFGSNQEYELSRNASIVKGEIAFFCDLAFEYTNAFNFWCRADPAPGRCRQADVGGWSLESFS